MYELIPILAGVAVGLAAARIDGTRTRAVAIGATALTAALAAGLLSGELEESWLFLLWDVAQCVVAAVLALALALRVPALARGASREPR